MFSLEELLGTKLRALYQRRKGLDLFDFWVALTKSNAKPKKIVEVFQKYMEFEKKTIQREIFEENLGNKMLHPKFIEDIKPLLVNGLVYNPEEAYEKVKTQIFPWL